MNVLIIEDEKLAAESLEHQLKMIEPGIKVMAKIATVRNAVAWLSENQADLIFLDINLSDGPSFTIFEQIEVKTPIIFTTAYNQYAKAFKVNSIDYLLKPIDRKDLKKSIEKFHERSKHTPDLESLLDTIRGKVSYKKRFLVYSGDKVKTIKTEDIAYFYVLQKNVFLCTSDNQNYSLDQSLNKLEKMVDPENFFRVNRRYIISLEAISDMFNLSRSRIKIELNPPPPEEVLVSFHRAALFRKWLNR